MLCYNYVVIVNDSKEMTKIFKTLAVLLIIFGGSCKESKGESVDDIIDNDEDKFLFTRAEPGNGLGIVTKIIAHIHRPVNKTTETWRLNREFTPTEVVTVLNSMCSEELIVSKTLKNSTMMLSRTFIGFLIYLGTQN